jgi:uncharacterized membrane protein YoaK (UPF0700 family)
MHDGLTIRYNTLILVLSAGFCDAITFARADELFSAHVTGNFILFAYDLVNGADMVTWVRLLTFPVFFAAVLVGGWISAGMKILRVESGVLIVGGLAVWWLPKAVFAGALMVVFAMGLQNAFGKLFSKEIYAPTTMMTGNVTQAALNLFRREKGDKDLLVLGGFLAGCIVGVVVGRYWGLQGIVLPGVALLLVRKVG